MMTLIHHLSLVRDNHLVAMMGLYVGEAILSEISKL